VVFGFDLSNPASPAPLRRFEDFTREAASGSRGPRVLVVCELVLCRGRPDFEPAGVLEAARVYPIAEIITDGEADIQMAINLRRPDRSAMDHGWFGGGNHIPSLYTDRNAGQGIVALLTHLTTGGFAVPTWANMFDYFDRSFTHRYAVAVDPAHTGTRGSHRPPVVVTCAHHHSSTMVARSRGRAVRQHPAHRRCRSRSPPVAVLGVGAARVSMAPRAHDCFHMHWRWGLGYTHIEQTGWGPRGPYTSGTRVVAPNRRSTSKRPDTRAFVTRMPADERGGDWAVVMPLARRTRGFASIRCRARPNLRELPFPLAAMRGAIISWVAASEDRAWAWIYFFLQYTPMVRSPHFAEVVKPLIPVSFLTLRRL
jgi:hypothetical protein